MPVQKTAARGGVVVPRGGLRSPVFLSALTDEDTTNTSRGDGRPGMNNKAGSQLLRNGTGVQAQGTKGKPAQEDQLDSSQSQATSGRLCIVEHVFPNTKLSVYCHSKLSIKINVFVFFNICSTG